MSIKKKQTYSDLINKCYSSNIRYLSVDEERMFTKHAIRIVIETKQKRKMMYAKKEDESLASGQQSMQNLDSKLTTVHEPYKGNKLVENSRDFTTSGIDQSTFVESSVRTSVKGNKYAINSGKAHSRLQSGKPKAFLTDINDSRSNAPSFTTLFQEMEGIIALNECEFEINGQLK